MVHYGAVPVSMLFPCFDDVLYAVSLRPGLEAVAARDGLHCHTPIGLRSVARESTYTCTCGKVPLGIWGQQILQQHLQVLESVENQRVGDTGAITEAMDHIPWPDRKALCDANLIRMEGDRGPR